MNQDDSAKNGRQTLVEEGTVFRGAFDADCPIVVKGRIEGEISGPSLSVSSTGSVSGTVRVKELVSDGELSGEYDAEVVRLSGTVKDNTIIKARQLEVSLSPMKGRMQVVFGECELEVGDVPSEEQALAEAMSEGKEVAPEVAADADVTDANMQLTAPSDASDENGQSGDGKNGRASGKGRSKGIRSSTLPPPA